MSQTSKIREPAKEESSSSWSVQAISWIYKKIIHKFCIVWMPFICKFCNFLREGDVNLEGACTVFGL